MQRIERTLSQSRLSEFGVEVFKRAVDIVACASMQEPALMSQAVGLTHSDYDIPPHIVVHALNSYLSSEPFEGTHITAGTVFKAADETGWWVCVSPVCDMVPRPSRDGRSWQKELEPVRPVVALRLYEEGNAAKALEEAERGRILFIFNGAAPLCLRAFHDESRQPWTESLFLCSQGWQDEGGQKRFTFQGQRAKHKDGIAEVTLSDFEAVAQLRESYTGRLLQQTGAYTSRIGVDYVPLTAERVRREPAPAPSVETLVSTPEQQ